MPWIAAAAVVGGSLLQSSSARSASSAQSDATAQAAAENARQYDLTRSDFAPYRAAGVKALGQYETEINNQPTAAEVMAGPGYQFGLQQGQQALDRKTAAAGGRVSGAALKAASQYGTDYATTGYNAEYQRRQDRLNRLASLANVGQTATGSSAAAGSTAASSNANLISSQGNASGAASLAQGNIWAGASNQLGAIGNKWATTPAATTTGNSGYVYGGGNTSAFNGGNKE